MIVFKLAIEAMDIDENDLFAIEFEDPFIRSTSTKREQCKRKVRSKKNRCNYIVIIKLYIIKIKSARNVIRGGNIKDI